MRRNGIALGIGFAAAALVASGGLPVFGTDEKAKPATKEQVKELMAKTHKGDKSPFARAREELKKEKPDWDQLVKDGKAFAEMAALLTRRPGDYTDPTRYVEASESFGKAAGGKDAGKAADAFAKLSKSCSACHYGVPK